MTNPDPRIPRRLGLESSPSSSPNCTIQPFALQPVGGLESWTRGTVFGANSSAVCILRNDPVIGGDAAMNSPWETKGKRKLLLDPQDEFDKDMEMASARNESSWKDRSLVATNLLQHGLADITDVAGVADVSQTSVKAFFSPKSSANSKRPLYQSPVKPIKQLKKAGNTLEFFSPATSKSQTSERPKKKKGLVQQRDNVYFSMDLYSLRLSTSSSSCQIAFVGTLPQSQGRASILRRDNSIILLNHVR
jgi:hypothetical protein